MTATLFAGAVTACIAGYMPTCHRQLRLPMGGKSGCCRSYRLTSERSSDNARAINLPLQRAVIAAWGFPLGGQIRLSTIHLERPQVSVELASGPDNAARLIPGRGCANCWL